MILKFNISREENVKIVIHYLFIKLGSWNFMLREFWTSKHKRVDPLYVRNITIFSLFHYLSERTYVAFNNPKYFAHKHYEYSKYEYISLNAFEASYLKWATFLFKNIIPICSLLLRIWIPAICKWFLLLILFWSLYQ